MRKANPRVQRRYEYVLGDSKIEAARLEQQAKLWDPYAVALFERIGVNAGWRVLEIGPGRGSVHLELRQRVQGPIDAVERSAVFAETLRKRTRVDGFGDGRIWQTDLMSAALSPNTYDLIYARWVFCFLPDPELHVRKLARALKTGGLLAIQDYAHRESFALFPRPVEWLDFLAADRALFAAHGGDISIGGRLPAMYKRAGLQALDVTPIHSSGPPGSPVWEWLFRYFGSVRERIRRIPPLDDRKTTSLHKHWRAATNDRQAFVIAPTMVDLVGRK